MASYPPTRSATQLAQWVANDANLRQELASDPAALTRLVKPTRDASQWVYLVVVIMLGLTALGVVGGVFALKATNGNDVTIPDALVAIGSAAVAALAGLLAPSPAQTS